MSDLPPPQAFPGTGGGARSAPSEGRLRDIINLRSHAARGTLVNGAYQVGLVGLGALKGLVAAALISRSDYGVWGLLGLALWTVVGLKQQFGVSDKYVQQSEHDQELAFQRGFTVELIFAAAMLPAIALVVPAFALLTHHLYIVLPGLTLALMLPAIALQFPLWAYYREMDFRRQRIIQAVDPLVGTVVTVVLAVAGAGYWSLVVGLIAGSWGGALVALRFSPYPLAVRYHRGSLGSYVRFSAPLLVAGVATIATFQVIYLTGNHWLGLAGLGAFTLVGNLVQFTDQADSIITETLYPALCAVHDRTGVLFEAFVKSNRLALMWAAPFGVGLSLFAADIIRFGLGQRWALAIGLLQIMGVVTAVHHVGFNWHAFYKARGNTWPIAIAGVTSAIAVIATGIPLMASYGLVGLGWAFVAGEAVGLLTRTVFLARYFRGFRMVPHFVRAFGPTALAAGTVLGLRLAGMDDRTLGLAVSQLLIYMGLIMVLAIALERSLLREAAGYLLRRRQQAA